MKIEKLLLITGIAFSVWSCSKTDEEQVREVATSFLTAAAEQDFEEAASYCDESTKELLNSLQGLLKAAAAKQEKDKPNEFEIINIEVTENEARVIYIEDQGENNDLYLVKIDGEWKVSIDKEDKED